MTITSVQPTNPDHRLKRKRFNEHVKLLASALNTFSLGVLGAGLIIPVVSNLAFTSTNLTWTIAGLSLHLCAQGAMRLLRSED